MRKTVTIGIPAHNEGKTIGRLLDCILAQKQDYCVIEKVLVACDWCTDNTVDIVRSYQETHSFIQAIDDGERRGQGGRLSQFFQMNESDIFVTFDADTVLGSDSVVDELVKAFDTEKVGMVGGYDLPHPAEGFVESLVVTGIEMWQETRQDINGGDSVHNLHGCVWAATKELTKQVQFVQAVTSNDEFIYLKGKQLGFEFRYCRTAPVYYRAPSQLKDFLKQTARFVGCWDQLTAYFGDSISSYYTVPLKNKVMGVLKVFVRKPILTPLAIGLQVLSRITVPLYRMDFQGGFWSEIASSKK